MVHFDLELGLGIDLGGERSDTINCYDIQESDFKRALLQLLECIQMQQKRMFFAFDEEKV